MIAQLVQLLIEAAVQLKSIGPIVRHTRCDIICGGEQKFDAD